MEIIRSFKNLSIEEIDQLNCLEYVTNLNDIKTKNVRAILLDFKLYDEFVSDIETIKDLKCYNFLFKDINEDDLKIAVEVIKKNIKGSKISITKSKYFDTNDKIFEIIRKYDVCYYIDTLNENIIENVKTFKKHLSFVVLHDIDEYGYNSLAGSTLKTRELIDYLKKKRIDVAYIIDTDLKDYLELRNNYFKLSFFKKRRINKLNKSIKLFNYKIASNEEITYFDLINLETNYLNNIIKKDI